jgi:Peptidase A4 family
MGVKGPKGRRAIAGAAIALAMAGGLAAAGATGLVTTAAPAAHEAHVTATAHRPSLAQVRIALLRFLHQGIKPAAELTSSNANGGPNGVDPSITNHVAGSLGAAAVGSYNWSGYADYSSTPNEFTAVSGTWRQPATVCSREQELTAFWVGLDGYNTDSVEQDGTLSYCFEGQASYYSWWELYPSASVTVGSTVRPGDLISASVTRSGTSYTLSLTDHNSPANSFSETESCTSCSNESAEWIAERPEFPIGITPLTFFPSWSLTNASETAGGVTGSIAAGPNATSIGMVDATDTYALDDVSGLFDGGHTFNARWLDSY